MVLEFLTNAGLCGHASKCFKPVCYLLFALAVRSRMGLVLNFVSSAGVFATPYPVSRATLSCMVGRCA